MLATAVTTLPRGDGWAYEFKWDGVRTLLDVGEGGVRLISRAGNDVSLGYPEIVAQAADVGDALLDGEIVAFVDGRPSFERLQSRMHLRGEVRRRPGRRHAPVTFVAFDILRRYGVDLTARPYRERRATLERFAEEHEGWTLSPVLRRRRRDRERGPRPRARGRGGQARRLGLPAGRAQRRLAQAALRPLGRLRGDRLGGRARASRRR